jgi:hypothetical protein
MTCELCAFTSLEPELVIGQTRSWILAHTHHFFPLGSLYLIYRRHLLLPEVEPAALAEAGPLIAWASRRMTEQEGAQRVYLGSFTERYEHFHLLMMAKRPQHAAALGELGPRLISAFVDAGQLPPRAEILAAVERYRRSWSAGLSESGT